jgi:two-component system phosphate regulon sensor histidine kinase PhoR
MPLSRVRDILGEPRYLLAGTAFASVLFIFFAIYIVSFLVSKPLKELAGAAANIASGDKRERFLYRHNDEIGDLARSLNEMREQISKRLAEVLSGRSRLEAVLLSMFDGVMVLDKKGKIVLVNRALKNIFRIEKDLAGKSAIEALRNVEVQEITEDVLSGGRQSLAREIEVLVPDEKILVVHAAQIRRSEQVEGAVLVFHDISGIRKLENIRKDFVANVSHELRTPVSNIKGYTETLLEGAISDEKNAGQFLKIINEDSERLETLISDLLDLARLESGKLALDIGECDTRAFVENCIKEMTSKAETKNVQISPAIEKDIKHMKADPMRLAQCMRNLIDNAVKYTHRGDTIKVSAENDDGFIRISVRDNGPGIGEEHLPRIFERFYRVDKARSRELGGTGLGLSIVKHIVTEHGGTVTVRSVPGNGSEFSFTIPRA